MPLKRAEIIGKMRIAFRKGQSATSLYWELRAIGPVTRKTVFLADWRSVNQLERKEGVLRYVRKDYYPAKAAMAQITWETSKEYMYKIRTESRLRPREPVTTRFVNIMSDTPLTPRELEAQVAERWGEWEKYKAEELVSLQVWTAVQRVME